MRRRNPGLKISPCVLISDFLVHPRIIDWVPTFCSLTKSLANQKIIPIPRSPSSKKWKTAPFQKPALLSNMPLVA